LTEAFCPVKRNSVLLNSTLLSTEGIFIDFGQVKVDVTRACTANGIVPRYADMSVIHWLRDRKKMSDDIGTVSRTIQLLCCFGEREEWRVSELARRLNLPRSTAHRLLNLCRTRGFVDTDGRGTYCRGLGLYRLAGRLAFQMPLRRITLPLLTEFTLRFGETSLLTIVDRGAMKTFFAAKAEPAAPMRYVIEINKLEPLGWGATGLAILAYMSEAEIAEVIRRAEPSPADGRPLDAKKLLAALAEIRANGYAITKQQRTPEGVGIAVPFFDAANQVVGDVGVTVPTFRFRPQKKPTFVRALSAVAAKVSEALGSTRTHQVSHLNTNGHRR
jgi:IclR family KDG regulon transcriptional repressor